MVLTIIDIPVESLALILNMLDDVCDIQHVFECLPESRTGESRMGDLSALNWVHRTSRILTDNEVDWFAKRKLRVQLLVTRTVAIQSSGEPWKERWYLNGKLHRDNDEPAMIRYPHLFSGIYLGGKQVWYKHGAKHRDNDLPAEMLSGGTKRWFMHGNLHRDGDEPAEIGSDGTKKWYKHGGKHRDNDLPAEIYSDGTQLWYQHGQLHRDNDLPAVILSDGTKKWYINGHIQPLFRNPCSATLAEWLN